MESKQIKQILKQFDKKNTYRKIFINGDWGIGKSYYTNEYIRENSDNIVYISLFGKSSFDSVKNAISDELINKLNNVEKFKKKAKQIAKKINGSISFYGISISSPDFSRKTLFEEFSELLGKNDLVLIIDDLERKSGNILIEDVMGMIEKFSLYEKIKIVIIGDEKNIDKDDLEKWNKFKEKIIEKEYKITSFSYESIQSLVIDKLNEYINDKLLQEFISSFLLKHRINNLRTINKGINLFLEIVNNYLIESYNDKVYLCILKNCMAIAIEYTEELYKPNEDDKYSSDTTKSYKYAIDSDMKSRILSHYFGSAFINTKDSLILKYVLKIYCGEANAELKKEFNSALEKSINSEDEKNIFYLSQDNITKKVTKTYNDIIENTYTFKSLEEFVDDIYELINWNKALNLNFNVKKISEKFNKILLNKYYNINKELYDNQIDNFLAQRNQSTELKNLISSYNNLASSKFIHDKIDNIVIKYKEHELDIKYLEWLKSNFILKDKEEVIKYFIQCCRSNNFFIPNLTNEIDENEWGWTHYIWDLFYEHLNDNYKKELNEYVENLKTKNLLVKHRINVLQEYKPLVENNC